MTPGKFAVFCGKLKIINYLYLKTGAAMCAKKHLFSPGRGWVALFPAGEGRRVGLAKGSHPSSVRGARAIFGKGGGRLAGEYLRIPPLR